MNGPARERRERLAAGGLYVLTPTGIDLTWVDRSLTPVLAEHRGIVQLRLKQHDDDTAMAVAARLRELTRASGALFIVNDDISLAAASGADGVHLGREDSAIASARERLGEQAIIGASCYGDLARAAACREAGADYLAFGAIFASPTKPGATVTGTGVLEEARRRFQLPLVAIGGITPGRVAACRRAGADWVAVIDALWGADAPLDALHSLQAALAQAGT